MYISWDETKTVFREQVMIHGDFYYLLTCRTDFISHLYSVVKGSKVFLLL